ncbi:MAG TPA: hypothetical protein VFY92_00675 [Hyphomicrobiaceae bacterium]|nr:hypothetical protein [Hyphomicrobiaceae bacterium]
MFNVGARIGAGLMCAAAMALLCAGASLAQEKDPSDNSVRTFMRYAWAMLPEKFTPPNGKTIVVDKKKPKAVEVPLDVAREAVKVGYYSAHAQMCNLWEEQQANYDTLMLRQRTTGKWSDQQLLYIQKLHQVTVMIMTGKVTIVEKEGDVTVAQHPAKTNAKPNECSDANRQRVKTQIANYINAGPAPKGALPPKKK